MAFLRTMTRDWLCGKQPIPMAEQHSDVTSHFAIFVFLSGSHVMIQRWLRCGTLTSLPVVCFSWFWWDFFFCVLWCGTSCAFHAGIGLHFDFVRTMSEMSALLGNAHTLAGETRDEDILCKHFKDLKREDKCALEALIRDFALLNISFQTCTSDCKSQKQWRKPKSLCNFPFKKTQAKPWPYMCITISSEIIVLFSNRSQYNISHNTLTSPVHC